MMNEIPLLPPFLVVGLGKSGEAAKRLLLRMGIDPQKIFTFDDKAAANFKDPLQALQQADPKTMILSPGVPLSTPWIQEAIKFGVKISSEIGLASFFLENETLIGVTGSIGKSTTVALLGEAFRPVDPHVFVGGNFGFPLADYITDIMENKRLRAAYVVLELSSYQLENCEPLRVDHSLFVSLTPNHLERYATLEDYYLTKLTLVLKTERISLASDDSPELKKMFERISSPDSKLKLLLRKYGLTEKSFGHIRFVTRGRYPAKFFAAAKIFGSHNEANIALVLEIIKSLSLPKESQDAIFNYAGLPHRTESLGEKDGVLFINDSKSTTIESVRIAINSVVAKRANGVIYLLLGGRDKNLPWEDLKTLSQLKNVQFIFFGECRLIAQEKSSLKGPSYPKLEAALQHLKSTLKIKDTVLLSPGGTSLDEFKNFETRGNFFRDFFFPPHKI